MRRLVTLLVLVSLAGCGGDSNGPPDGQPLDDGTVRTLQQLVDDYENGVITRDAYLAGIAALPDSGAATELSGMLDETTFLSAGPVPYRITGELTLAAGKLLVVEAGTEIIVSDTVNVNLDGRFYAIGTAAEPIRIHAEEGNHYDTWFLNSGPNQLVHVELERGTRNLYESHPIDTHTLVESCRFDYWTSIAIGQLESANLFVHTSEFGLQTPYAEQAGEAIRTRMSGFVLVQDSSFGHRRGYNDAIDLQDCTGDDWPVVLHNDFAGGEDDGVDLDHCSAFVIGNTMRGFSPPDLSVEVLGVNGGGVTGDRFSRPFIANNVIDGCFHGIGFKNGARPVMVNNTIINSNIGITLYKSAVGKPEPSGIAINNVLWNNIGWIDGQPHDVILNGKWWPEYDQTDDVQATLDARFNITATSTAYPGQGNTNEDPMLEMVDGVPVPKAGSPAIDTGLGDLSFEDLPLAQALDFLNTDRLDHPRTRNGDTFSDVDRGAVEVQ